MTMSRTSIGLIGAGFVGKAIGQYFVRKEYNVKFYDKNLNVVENLQNEGFNATAKIEELSKCKYLIVSVPTPTDSEGNQVLEHILDATMKIANIIKNSSEEHIIILKSTLLPGTTQNIVVPIFGKLSNADKIGVIYSPEFLTEINSTWIEDEKYNVTPENEYRLVIGEGEDKRWGDEMLEELYFDIAIPIIRTDYKTAEFIKYASNNALAARISYWNEIFLVCKELGIDSNIVAQAAALDPRIGKYGTIHGKAFGGKCLPKDLAAFIRFAKMYRTVPLHQAVKEVNDEMREKYGIRE